MSFWGKVKHTANKAKKGAEKAGKKAGDAIKDTAEDAAKEVERLAKEAEKLAMSAIGDVKKLLKDVENVANKAKREIDGVAKKAERGITDTANKAKREVEDSMKAVARECEDGIRKAANEIEDTFKERIPEFVTEALPAALKDVGGEIIEAGADVVLQAGADAVETVHRKMTKWREDHPDLVGEIDKLGFTLELKVNAGVKLYYGEFYHRAESIAGVLRRFAKEGVKLRRRDITAIIESTGPTSIDPGISAAVALGVDAAAKGSLNKMSGKLFARVGDEALEALGVPE